MEKRKDKSEGGCNEGKQKEVRKKEKELKMEENREGRKVRL